MVYIEFEYADDLNNLKCCTVSSVEECKRIYGLGL